MLSQPLHSPGPQRDSLKGEIKPTAVTQSSTKFGSPFFGPENAVDGDLSSVAWTEPHIISLFQAVLDSEYCITQVIRFWGTSTAENHTYFCENGTCSGDDCAGCDRYSINLSLGGGGDTRAVALPGFSCVFADKVTLSIPNRSTLWIRDLAIIAAALKNITSEY